MTQEILRPALLAVKALIATPDHWTTKWFARDKQGQETSPNDYTACQWCLMGALIKTCVDTKVSNYYDTAQFLANLIPEWRRAKGYTPVVEVSDYPVAMKISNFNDKAGFIAVHELLDSAIATVPHE